MLHYSQYNCEVELPDGSKAVYNLVTGKKLLLKGVIATLYKSVIDAPDTRLAKKWLKQGFLAEGNEVTKLKLLHFAALNATDYLNLTICPTRSCNFRCPYCYEQHLAGSMSEEVQEKLLAFVKRFMEEHHPKSFNVTWFGGEPLLYPQIIEHLSAAFIKLCDKHKVAYDAGIITNGYFFTQKNVDMLEAAQIKRVQITLDGPKEQHNKTRILADGSGSYDVIMGNLKTVKTKMRIHVRCNTNTENRASYQELENIIRTLKETTGNNILSYPAFMNSDITADKSKLDKQSLDYEGYVEKEKSSRVNTLGDIKYRPGHCIAQHAASFVVRDDGSLCKCWSDATIKERTVANLMEDVNPILAQFSSEWGQKYLGMDIFADQECHDCQWLPFCYGGCPSRRLNGKKQCSKKLAKRVQEVIIKSFIDEE